MASNDVTPCEDIVDNDDEVDEVDDDEENNMSPPKRRQRYKHSSFNSRPVTKKDIKKGERD
jgi:hypothetical protein